MPSQPSPDNEAFIQPEIDAGVFRSREEALNAGVELLKGRKRLFERVNESRRQLDVGEFVEHDDDSLRSYFDALKERARNGAGAEEGRS